MEITADTPVRDVARAQVREDILSTLHQIYERIVDPSGHVNGVRVLSDASQALVYAIAAAEKRAPKDVLRDYLPEEFTQLEDAIAAAVAEYKQQE